MHLAIFAGVLQADCYKADQRILLSVYCRRQLTDS